MMTAKTGCLVQYNPLYDLIVILGEKQRRSSHCENSQAIHKFHLYLSDPIMTTAITRGPRPIKPPVRSHHHISWKTKTIFSPRWWVRWSRTVSWIQPCPTITNSQTICSPNHTVFITAASAHLCLKSLLSSQTAASAHLCLKSLLSSRVFSHNSWPAVI